MALSARNQLPGTVKTVVRDGVMAEVTVIIDGGQEIVSTITAASVDRLDLQEG